MRPSRALAATVIAIVLDRGAVAPDVEHLGAIGRLAAVGSLALIAGEPAAEVAVVAAVVVALAAIDALRQRDPLPLFALPVGLPVSVATSALAVGATTPQAGLALALLAARAAGIAALVPPGWTSPVLATMVAAGLAALAASSGDLAAFSTTLLVLGAIGAGASGVHRSVIGGIGAGVVVTVGIWGHLVARHDGSTRTRPGRASVCCSPGGGPAGSTRRQGRHGPAVVVLAAAPCSNRRWGGVPQVAGTVAVAAPPAPCRQAGPLLLGTVATSRSPCTSRSTSPAPSPPGHGWRSVVRSCSAPAWPWSGSTPPPSSPAAASSTSCTNGSPDHDHVPSRRPGVPSPRHRDTAMASVAEGTSASRIPGPRPRPEVGQPPEARPGVQEASWSGTVGADAAARRSSITRRRNSRACG
jgi:hypothetical protein